MCEGFADPVTIYYQSVQASRRGGDMHSGDRVWRERGLRDAVLAGDERAWRTLYDESFAGLYAYVLWRCAGLRDRADEAVQETWLTAVRRVGRFDLDAGSFAGWLHGIAANVLRNQFRRHQRRERQRRPLSDETPAVPDAERDRLDRAERIAAALNALPDRYEAVLRAKYLEGRSVADIALDVRETPKAIESLLSRARQAFRDAYGTEEDEHHA
jgi:RNA polymerase sigma-70 factor (ECF subfamily)